jgi:hypothetical protein
MKTLNDYKKQAIRAAHKDAKDGFKYHCMRNASSKRIDAITGGMIANGFNNADRDIVAMEWECAL